MYLPERAEAAADASTRNAEVPRDYVSAHSPSATSLIWQYTIKTITDDCGVK